MKTIGICARSFSPGWQAMFDALGGSLGILFERRTFGDDRNIDGWVVLGADRKLVSEIPRAKQPCYVVLDEAERISCGTSSKITFANCSELAAVLRGRDITADDATDAKALPRWLHSVTPLAFKDGSAVWAIEQQGRCQNHYVALAPPELNPDEPLFTHFSGRRIACLLPLMLFLRSLAEDHSWQPHSLQATFMFDDPNLHWTSYGFIHYREMVRRADTGNYHVSIATIPLDAWFVYGRASAVFTENIARISLLYHGNDHVFRELGQSHSAEITRRILRQAVGRIAGMEERAGIEVARVMAPPHGACSETALSEMARLGFEAVCVSRGSLRYHNNGAAWTRTIGMRQCDFIAGLPVISRFGLSKDCRNDILIAALLHQPIVPVAHHQAVADGYDLLDDIASFVNSLGEVAWSDMRTIARSMYSQRQDNGTLSVRMLSKRVTVPLPRDATQIRVERPWLDDLAEEALFWRPLGGDPRWKVEPSQATITVEPGATVEIASGPAGGPRIERHGPGPRRLVPVARRILTEARDRALPSVHRIARMGRSRPA